jgi:putative Holliday junction resolvase
VGPYNGRVRYLGVDPGGRRIGLALGDDSTGVVTPVEVVPARGLVATAELIVGRARRMGAECVVVGLPTRDDGQETPACRRSHALAHEIAARGVRVALQGELLTTDEARRRARSAGLPRQAPVDHIAAQVLLEEYLAGAGGRRGGCRPRR